MADIFLDVDGTLLPYGVEFKSLVKEMSVEKNKEDLETVKKAHYERIKFDKGYDADFNRELYERVEFFEGVESLILGLVESGHKISFITSSSSAGQKKFKLKKLSIFLSKVLGDKKEILKRFEMNINTEKSEVIELPEGIIAASAKYKHTVGAILVDDTLKAIAEHIMKNKTPGVLVNIDGEARISEEKLSELKGLLAELNLSNLLIEIRSIDGLKTHLTSNDKVEINLPKLVVAKTPKL